MSNPSVNVDAVKSEIRAAVINQKANVCPMIVRLAWHASGTYDKNDGSGGSNGGMTFLSFSITNFSATMRFEPEQSDPANNVCILCFLLSNYQLIILINNTIFLHLTV